MCIERTGDGRWRYTGAEPGWQIEIPVERSFRLKLSLKVVAICCLAASMVTPAFAQSGGADTYKAKCVGCHGADGQATPIGKKLLAPSFKDPAVVKAPDAQLIAIIKNGKNKMPAYTGKLSDGQIKSVVAYIRTLQK